MSAVCLCISVHTHTEKYKLEKIYERGHHRVVELLVISFLHWSEFPRFSSEKRNTLLPTLKRLYCFFNSHEVNKNPWWIVFHFGVQGERNSCIEKKAQGGERKLGKGRDMFLALRTVFSLGGACLLILKFIELYTVSMDHFSYVHHTSIRWFREKKENSSIEFSLWFVI